MCIRDRVAHFTKILANANINIRWLAVASTGPFGVMKFLVSDPEMAYQALKHEGFVAKLVDALAIEAVSYTHLRPASRIPPCSLTAAISAAIIFKPS